MKKLLFSTMALGALAVVAMPSVVSANKEDGKQVQNEKGETRAWQDSEVGVEFGKKTLPPSDIFVGNLVMAYLPESIDFGIHEASVNARSVFNPDNAIRSRTEYLVINDDRPEIEDPEGTPENDKGKNKKMKSWTVRSTMTKLEAVGGQSPADDIDASITFEKMALEEYNTGDVLKVVGGVEDYDHKYPGENISGSTTEKNIKAYDGSDAETAVTGDWAKPGTNQGKFTIEGGEKGAAGTVVLSKPKDGLDPNHSQKDRNGGNKKGGQGYALSFNRPTLNIKGAQKDNTAYKATLTWLLESGDAPAGWTN